MPAVLQQPGHRREVSERARGFDPTLRQYRSLVLPAWATVVVAVIASAVGGAAVGLLQMRHDRLERSRDRMLNAADDLATGLAQALLVGRHAVAEL